MPIMDAIPSFAKLVERFHAGIVVSPTPDEIADAICRLMLDETLYQECVEGCFSLSNEFGADRVYEGIFAVMMERMNHLESLQNTRGADDPGRSHLERQPEQTGT